MSPPTLAWRAASALHLGLIVAVALREWSALGLVLALILCLPLPGILRGKTYTAAWASMLVGFYVAGYLAAGYARPPQQWEAFAMGALAAADYISLMLFVRWRAREVRLLQAAAPTAQTESSGGAAH